MLQEQSYSIAGTPSRPLVMFNRIRSEGLLAPTLAIARRRRA